MIHIQLKDGSVRTFDEPVTGSDLALSLSKSLEKVAVALKLNGKLVDLTTTINQDCQVEIITRDNPEGLEILRHDAAHVMAQAAKELFPEAQVTIGPAIENGFYYDFYREKPFTPEDLEALEKKMGSIVDRDDAIVRQEWTREKAIEYFKSIGEDFKVELIESIPEGDVLSVYQQGDFIDLCRGPHLPSTKKLGKAFKLMSLAGAYWRGDHNNPMLQRIYGTAWSTKEDLENYLFRLEEAKKRDHRKLGAELDLFHIQEEAPGSVFWHPKGWTIYRLLMNFVREHLEKNDYVEVNTPALVDRSLWEASGHWEKFRESMFTVETEDKTFAVKPMNCPCHVQIFKQGMKSYRDLPLRMAEFGSCYRNEPSGALHGLMRVRAFVQDDAHIFCTPDQIISEAQSFFILLKNIYRGLGFDDISIKFSDRPEKRAGNDAVWDKAEKELKEAAESAGLSYTLNPGEGAFYGPKLEFVLKDALNREWQCGTLQVDFVLPERLGATYIGEDGQKHIPVMIHRAALGSLERMVGVLIEHYGGHMPLWLSPVQIRIATITSEANEYAQKVCSILKEKGYRAEADLRNEKINFKVRESSLQKVPVLLAVGKKEALEESVSLRVLGDNTNHQLSLQEVLDKLDSMLQESKRV